MFTSVFFVTHTPPPPRILVKRDGTTYIDNTDHIMQIRGANKANRTTNLYLLRLHASLKIVNKKVDISMFYFYNGTE